MRALREVADAAQEDINDRTPRADDNGDHDHGDAKVRDPPRRRR